MCSCVYSEMFTIYIYIYIYHFIFPKIDKRGAGIKAGGGLKIFQKTKKRGEDYAVLKSRH